MLPTRSRHSGRGFKRQKGDVRLLSRGPAIWSATDSVAPVLRKNGAHRATAFGPEPTEGCSGEPDGIFAEDRHQQKTLGLVGVQRAFLPSSGPLRTQPMRRYSSRLPTTVHS